MSSPMQISSTAHLAAAGLLAGGLTVTSTGDSALNGTYACTSAAMEALSAEALSLALNNSTFVDGSTTVAWPDKAGAAHSFSEAQFRTLVNAINLFVVGCFQYGCGVTSSPPSSNATIP